MDGDAYGWVRGAALRGLLMVASLSLVLAGLEGFVRVVDGFGGLLTASRILEPDPELGWRLRTDSGEIRWTNGCRERVVLAPPAGPYLARRPVAPGRVRVLFLGDSHTHAATVSTGDAYFDRIGRDAPGWLEIWVAAVPGFGSLQELGLLERAAAEAKPEVVVWQLTENDVHNNVFVLDDSSILNNQRPRPYLDPESGEITTANPGPPILDRSQLALWVFATGIRVDRRHGLGWERALDGWLRPPLADADAARRQGLAVLAFALRQARAAHPATRFVGFSADAGSEDAYAGVFEAEGAQFVRGVPAALAAEPAATDCRPNDSHWNRRGHEVVARTLSAWLETNLRPVALRPTDAALTW